MNTKQICGLLLGAGTHFAGLYYGGVLQIEWVANIYSAWIIGLSIIIVAALVLMLWVLLTTPTSEKTVEIAQVSISSNQITSRVISGTAMVCMAALGWYWCMAALVAVLLLGLLVIKTAQAELDLYEKNKAEFGVGA